jgi:hypothetical protein
MTLLARRSASERTGRAGRSDGPAAILVALCLALVACGGSSDTPTVEAAGPTSTQSSQASVGADILNFTATGLDGTSVNGSMFAGRPVGFWFWAPY